MFRRRVSRRAMLGTSGAAGALFLAACSGSSSNNNNNKTAATGTTAATRAAGTAAPGVASATRAAGASPAAGSPQAGGNPVNGSFYSAFVSLTGSTLDMHRELYTGIAQTAGLAYDALIAWADVEKGLIKPEIAASLPEQPDNQTYVFTLRDDVTWQNKAPANGRKLTMDDIKWNIERQRAQKLVSGDVAKNFYRYPSLYQFIDNVEYTDATHLTIKLKAPRAIWLGTFSEQFNVIQYKELMEDNEKNPALFDAKYIVGTGPYIFDDYTPTKRAHAVRNPDYFLKKAGQQVQFFDEMLWTDLGPDENALRVAFEQKQIDIITASKGTIDGVQSSLGKQIQRVDIAIPNNNLNLHYNYSQSPAFSNLNLRKAVHLAIDRQLCIQQKYQGLARPEPFVPWPYVDWALPQTELATLPGYRTPKDDDIKMARQLWAAGAGDSFPKSIFEFTITDTVDQSIKEWWPAMINKNLGTDKFALRAIPGSSLLAYLTDPTSNGYIGAWTLWDSPDPRSNISSYVAANGNINWYKQGTQAMRDLSDKALAEFDRTKAIDYIRQLQRLAADDGGSGQWDIAGAVTPYLEWNYLHREGPSFIPTDKQLTRRSWIDQTDPTFQGKKKF